MTPMASAWPSTSGVSTMPATHLESGGDLHSLRGLTEAGAAAAHADFPGLEREAALHGRAAVAFERGHRLVEMRAHEVGLTLRCPPHRRVDLSLRAGRLVAPPGGRDPAPGRPCPHDRVGSFEALAVGHDGRHGSTLAEEA